MEELKKTILSWEEELKSLKKYKNMITTEYAHHPTEELNKDFYKTCGKIEALEMCLSVIERG